MALLRLRLGLAERHSGERGMTLVELIVAIALFAVVATLIMTTVTTFSRTFTRDKAATTNTNTAAIGMNEVTRIIRSGTALPIPSVVSNRPVFELADKENMILASYVANTVSDLRPVRVQFRVDPTQRVLVENRWQAVPYSAAFPTYWNFSSTLQSSRVVARTIALPKPGENSMFTYYMIDTAGNEVLVPIPTGGITDPAVLARIAVVKVTMKVQSNAHDLTEPVTLTNRVGIPNLGVPRVGSI